MKVHIRCQHCNKVSWVEDMGAFRCQHCGKFFASISEYMRQQIFGKQEVNHGK